MSRNPCRLCLDSFGIIIDIFCDSWKEKKLQFKIHKLFSFWINPHDIFRCLCMKCIHRVVDFYKFYEHVKQAQINLSEKEFVNSENFAKKLKDGTQIDEYQDDSDCIKITEERVVQEQTLSEKVSENGDCIIIKEEQIVKQEYAVDSKKSSKSSLVVLLEKDYRAEFIDNKEYLKLKTENIDNELSPHESFAHNIDQRDLDSDDNLLTYKNIDTNFEDVHPDDTVYKKTKTKKTSDRSKKHKHKIELLEDSPNFPVELIRDGKLVMKGAPLDELINKFYTIQCVLCTSLPRFKKISKLMKHFAGVHETQGYLTCCNTRLFNHRSIYLHMARHLQPSAFECPICKKAVTRPHTLKLHMQTHLPETEKLHKCDECDQRFSYIGGLTSHKQSHHVPVEERKTFHCNLCGKGNLTSTGFDTTASADSLSMHTILDEDMVVSRLLTYNCSRYMFRSTLSTHLRTHQLSSKFLCAECGRTLQSKSELSCHMLTHDQTGKHRVQCKHCGFVCKNLLSLKIHEKRHSGIKFTCKECPYSSHRKQQLKEHVRVKHTDEKPFTCVVCGKSFKLKSVLNNHMAQHTGEVKYSCSFCSRTFASSGNCYSHRKRMHADEYKNELNKKLKERFKKLEVPESDTKEKMEINHIHKLAREYLEKVSGQAASKALS